MLKLDRFRLSSVSVCYPMSTWPWGVFLLYEAIVLEGGMKD